MKPTYIQTDLKLLISSVTDDWKCYKRYSSFNSWCKAWRFDIEHDAKNRGYNNSEIREIVKHFRKSFNRTFK